MLQRLHRALDVVVLAVTVPLTVVMLACVVWQVMARYFLGVSTSITDELARFLFIWVSLLGAAYVLGRRGHIAITILVEMAPRRLRLALELASGLLVLLFSLIVLGYGGWILVERALSLGQVSAAMQLRMWLVYAVIPISGVLTTLYSLIVLAGVLSGERPHEHHVSLD